MISRWHAVRCLPPVSMTLGSLRRAARYANPSKHNVIVTGGNYLTDCAASYVAFTVTCSEQHGGFTVLCSEMPPSGQHDNGVSWWCIARYAKSSKHHVIVTRGNYLTDCATFAEIRSEQRGACTEAYGEMPPSGQHDIGDSVWCVAFTGMRSEQCKDFVVPYTVPTH
jgi:hypothetical protein